MLALAETFVERGHDVTWLGQPSIESRAVLAGCRFVPFQGVPSYEPRVEIEEQLPAVMALIAFKEAGEQLTRVKQAARGATSSWSTAISRMSRRGGGPEQAVGSPAAQHVRDVRRDLARGDVAEPRSVHQRDSGALRALRVRELG